jgi:pyruvate formate lyase activating enzyme
MRVQCDLCPKSCIIEPGQSGECRIRVNLDGKLVAVTYGHPCTVHVDPIEKKPFFHFLPGSDAFSLATVGCNLHCKNCQNWEISQANPEDVPAHPLPPEDIPRLAKGNGCPSVAYTYTDPSVYFEYVLDACLASHAAGIRNVIVTAGYLNPEPVKKLYRHMDAVKVDLKSMSDQFYRDICGATLGPVLNTCLITKDLGVHLEITNLVIPTLNDSDEDFHKLCKWIAENLGRETPIHFSRFHPDYQLRNLPSTPEDTILRAADIARSEGLYHPYLGNVMIRGGEDTHCPACGKLLIERVQFRVLKNEIKDGKCPQCGKALYGVWT